jgi:hypothetical protein
MMETLLSMIRKTQSDAEPSFLTRPDTGYVLVLCGVNSFGACGSGPSLALYLIFPQWDDNLRRHPQDQLPTAVGDSQWKTA